MRNLPKRVRGGLADFLFDSLAGATAGLVIVCSVGVAVWCSLLFSLAVADDEATNRLIKNALVKRPLR